MAEKVEETQKLWREYVYGRIAGKLSSATIILLGRAYYDGRLDKPIEHVTDTDLLSIYGIGTKRLAEIRKVIPALAKEAELLSLPFTEVSTG